MKKLLVLLFFLTACASSPEVVYVVVTETPEPTPETANPSYYFNSWEASNVPGMLFVVDNYYLIFARGEAAGLHEVGHIRDIEEDRISERPEFEDAVILYLETCEEQPCWRINYFYEQGQLSEVYAELYMWNILYDLPKEFIDFY